MTESAARDDVSGNDESALARRESYHFDSEHPPAEMLERIAHIAEQWDGEWQGETEEAGGRLGLPVTAGLRRGWLAGRLEVAPRGAGSHLHFAVDRGQMKTNRGSVLVLLTGALGGLVTVVAPFFPKLWPLVPIGLLLGFSAWFMVVARLRSAGPEEFFAQAEDDAPSPGS